MEGKAVKNKYSLSLMLIALFMSSLAGQSKDHLSESNVNKDRLPKVKKDSFAEAMKEIEEIRERDIAKEIYELIKRFQLIACTKIYVSLFVVHRPDLMMKL